MVNCNMCCVMDLLIRGTFVDNVILGDRERRVIEGGTLFTIGATSIILHTPDED